MYALFAEIVNYFPVLLLLYFLFKFLAPEQKSCESDTLQLKHEMISLRVAKTLCAKKVGLLNHSSLANNSGLKLNGIRAIHTHGMAFAIDLLFVDSNGTVLEIHSQVEPGRVVRGPRKSASTIELAVGTAQRNDVQSGDVLVISGYKKS